MTKNTIMDCTHRSRIIKDDQLLQLVQQHQHCCHWTYGKPIAVFQSDGYPCVRYETGAWWHYDLDSETWW